MVNAENMSDLYKVTECNIKALCNGGCIHQPTIHARTRRYRVLEGFQDAARSHVVTSDVISA